MADTTATFYPIGTAGTAGSTWSVTGPSYHEAVSDPDDPLGDANTYITSESGSTNFTGDPGRIVFRVTDINSWGDGPYVWDNNKNWTLSIRYRVRNVFGSTTPDVDIWLKNPPTDNSTSDRVHRIVEAWGPTSTSWATASWTFSRSTHSPPSSNPKGLEDMWNLGISLERQGGGNTEYSIDITWIKLEIVHPDAPPNDQWGTGRVPTSAANNEFENWVPSTDAVYETIDDQRPADDDTSYIVPQRTDGGTTMFLDGSLSGSKGAEEWIMARWKRGNIDPAYVRVRTVDSVTGANHFPAEDGDAWYVFKSGITSSTDWVETWLKLASADKSGVLDNTTNYELESQTPTPTLADLRLTQVIWTATGTNNQTVTPEVASGDLIALAPEIKADGDGSDDDGEQDPPGVTEYEPPWLYASPSANVHDQVGHLDLAGFPDLINRAPKWVWRATKRLHDDIYRERQMTGDATARFGMPLEGQVVFDGSASVSGSPSDHPVAASTAGGSVAVGYNGIVYIIGPRSGSGFGHHYAYDPSDDTYTAIAPIPDEAAGNGFYCEIDDILHYVAAKSGSGVTQHYAYNPVTDSWDTGSFTPPIYRRVRFAGAAIDGRIYLFGGVDSDTSAQTAVAECWDSRDDSWTRIADLPLGPRQDIKAARWGQFAFLFGGFGPVDSGNSGARVSEAIRYDTVSDSWRVLPPITYGTAEVARWSPFVETLNQKIYVCGGLPASGLAVATVSVFDPVTEEWSDGPTMPRSNSGGGSAVAGGSMYVIRGTTGVSPYKTVDRLVGGVPIYTSSATHMAAPALIDGDGDQTNPLLNTTTGANGAGLAFEPGDDVAIKVDDASVDWNTSATVYATIIGRGGRVDG